MSRPERAAGDPPRILLLSFRDVDPAVSRCATFEFEDVVAEVDAVEFAALPAQPCPFPRVVSRLDAHAPFLTAPLRNDPRPGRSRYDLLFVWVHSAGELNRAQPLSQYLDLADVTVACVDELWKSDLFQRTGELALLRRFDQLYSPSAGTIQALAELTSRPSHYLPPSIDALRFCPFPANRPREIDVYLMGRRRLELHRALREVTAATNRFYLFDTSGHTAVFDYAEHRERLAELIGRTRYFVVDFAKADWADQIGDQQEFGVRYFEAAAAGAVLIGRAPRTATFQEVFGWRDSVIPIADEPGSVRELLDELDRDTERVLRIRRENVLHSLRRHDHVYRWQQILANAGLAPLPAVQERQRRLEERAKRVEDDSGAAPLRALPATAVRP